MIPSLQPPGAARVAANLAVGLSADGFDAELWAGESQPPGVTLPRDLRLVDLDARTAAGLRARATEQLRNRPVAALIGVTHSANLAALEARAAAAPEARVAVTLHMTLSLFLADEPRRLARLGAEIGLHYPAADALIAVSGGVAQDAARLSGMPLAKFHVIPNPIVTPEIAALSREPVDHPWFAPGQPPVVVGAGRLAPQKDFLTLIHAFRLARDVRPARLLILGEGPQRQRLEAAVGRLGLARDVALPGHAGNPFAYMARAAVFALSSVHEGLPTVLVEALACGVPVVSTDCPSGPREVLEGGRLGPLVGVGKPVELASALLAVLDKTPPTEELRARAQDFSVEKAVAEYRRVLGLAGLHAAGPEPAKGGAASDPGTIG